MAGLEFSVEEGILQVTFHKPEAGNSFGIDEAEALGVALKRYRKTARGLLFKSHHPRLFCAGGDLKHHAKLKSKVQGLKEAQKIRFILAGLKAWPIPKVALVTGDCFGGGMELLSCFDHRVANPHVLFGFWQRRIGLSFGWGGYQRWVKIIPAAQVKDLTWSARVFGTTEALRRGIVSAVGGEDLAQLWLRQTLKWSDSSGLALANLQETSEVATFQRLWWGADHQKSLRKFAGKLRP